MIVNEIAKFWNPPIARKSSCAYPSLWRIRSSSEVRISGVGAVLIETSLDVLTRLFTSTGGPRVKR